MFRFDPRERDPESRARLAVAAAAVFLLVAGCGGSGGGASGGDAAGGDTAGRLAAGGDTGANGEEPRDFAKGMHVVMLGTGTPNADPDRWGPSVAVVVDGVAFIVDAGPGVVRRAAAAARLGVEALEASRLETAFLTHLHSDHTLGLPDLIFSPWVLERARPLRLYGPSGTAEMVGHLQAAWSEDVRVRLEGLEPANSEGYRVETHEIGPGVVYVDGSVRVVAFRVPHGAWEEAYGYRFETPDRTVVISGDTAPSEAVVEACGGCDLLIHEVYSASAFERRAPEWQRYHASSHTSTLELAELAARARPRLLVLYHQLFWGATPDDLLAEVRSVYAGSVVSATDLEIF